MASSEDLSDAEVEAAEVQIPGYLPDKSILKPKLDSIFAEVAKNLPDIDFELSDVSSDDDEVAIFHRQLKTPTEIDVDKDLDESLTERSFMDDNIPVFGKVETKFIKTRPTPGQKNIRIESVVHDDDVNTQGRTESSKQKSVSMTTVSCGVGTDDLDPLPVPKLQTWVQTTQTERGSMERIRTTRCAGAGLMGEMLGSNSNSLINEMMSFTKNFSTDTDDLEVDDIQISVATTCPDNRERKKTKSVTSQDSRRVVSQYISSEAPLLPLQNIEHSNLDLVLANLCYPTDAATGDGCRSPRPPPVEPLHNNDEDRRTLIERLAELSAQESGQALKDVDPKTGAIRKKPPSKAEKAARNAEAINVKKVSGMGTNTKDLQNYAMTLHPEFHAPAKKEERETVFIDLRNFDQDKKERELSFEAIQRILQIQQEQSTVETSSDDDSDADDNELWFEQRKRMKGMMANKGVLTDVLPSKSQPPKTNTPKPTSPRKPPVPKTRPAPIDMGATSERTASLAQTGTPANTPVGLFEDQAALKDEREKERRLEVAKKLRDQREAERQSRIRLGKRLEALRPTTSVSGKRPSAEATPTVFDSEGSYEQAPASLPSVLIGERECCLLTCIMSSNGEIVTHRGSVNKSVDSGHGLSASYTSLLTWLLSLVPDNYTFLKMPLQSPGDDLITFRAPFAVIGLQQMWFEEQLRLIIAVTPIYSMGNTPTKSKKAKARDETTTPFQQSLIKFLSTNTLHTVCPWLAELVSMDVTSRDMMQSDSDSSKPHVYRPSLPNITVRPLSTFLQVNPDPNSTRKIFTTPCGFFWQTVDSDEQLCLLDIDEEHMESETQITMSLIYKKVFTDPTAMMGILNRVLQEGLDISGVRLTYPASSMMNTTPEGQGNTELEMLNKIGPILAVGIRGACARTIWLDTIGPADPILARKTDPKSLCALFGGNSRDECLLFCPRNPGRIISELVLWFGGRVPPSGVIDVGTPTTPRDRARSGSPKSRKTKKVPFSTDKKDLAVPSHRPPALLTAMTLSDVFMAISPLLPTQCLGLILVVCQRRGYQVRGIRRTKLTSKKANCLGLSGQQLTVFSPASPTSLSSFDDKSFDFDSPPGESRRPCTLLLLRKENAMHNSASLIEAFMVQMSLRGVLGPIQHGTELKLNSSHLFQAVSYSDGLLHSMGGDFTKTPDHEITPSPSYIAPALYTNPEMEQVVTMALTGRHMMKTAGMFVAKLSNLVPYAKSGYNYSHEGFEILGIKWLPSLSNNQAKVLTPYEIGDRHWKASIHTLTSEPALVLVVRGVNAFQRLSNIIATKTPPQSTNHTIPLEKLMSPSPELAYDYTTKFFHDRELYPDPQMRPLLSYLPDIKWLSPGCACAVEANDSAKSLRKSKSKTSKLDSATRTTEESIFHQMLAGPRQLTTVLVIKPDGVRRNLAKILKRIDQEGFSIIAWKHLVMTAEQVEGLISQEECQNEVIFNQHKNHLTSGPSVILTLQRENAIKKLVDLLGPSDPQQARRQSQFLLRGAFGIDPVSNALYGSTNYVKSIKELKLFFPDGLCCKENDILKSEEIVFPAVDDNVDIKRCNKRALVVDEAGQSTLHVSSLTQMNCVVLTPPLLQRERRGRRCGFVDVIEGLTSAGFDVIGSKLIWFTEKQAENFLHLSDAGSFALLPKLLSGPSIVLALQRDNAVLAFDSFLGSEFQLDSLLVRYGEHVMRLKDTKQVERLLLYFFDELIPGAQARIVEKL
ncbi:dynein axonemal assembly factor 8-like [Lineus longissimus]|uniref:dynein axonemal assembly factor 8-like n=1 Tax=Lineus longissimus TaxID=88925 RepID=UPI002B4DA68A